VARKLRNEFAGAIVHVYARGSRQQNIYVDDSDRRLYLSLLGRAIRRHRWCCLAYCLMDNHVHLLLETSEPNLGCGMQRLHGDYAQRFNRRHGGSGHVFQGRYGAVVVRRDEQLLAVARYIALNPVTARLCSLPTEWPWSSHAAVVSGVGPWWLDTPRLLAYFGAGGGDPRQRYVEYVT
jgi:REP-associated tyrosine transposase